jgi:type II secretory pathway pseudopilin PulG
MRNRGYSLLELLFVVTAFMTTAAITIPSLLTSLDHYRTSGAARYVAARIQRTRMEAIGRSTQVALQFVSSASSYSYGVYADGNGNGVRSQDISDGVDPLLSAVERLTDNFAGVNFDVLPNLPPVDAGSEPPGTDPIKLGVGNLLSYSASGSSSSGSVYILGRRKVQYVVRVLGDTGRARVLRFDQRSRQWTPV